MSTHHRSRRQATACTSCRHRRVRCNRERPSCLQCSKRKQVCEYIDMPPTQIEFVAESMGSARSSIDTPSMPPETWKSVFEPLAPLAGKAELETQSPVVASLNFSRGTPRSNSGRERGGRGEGQYGSTSAQTELEIVGHSDDLSFFPSDPAIQIGSLGESFLSLLFDSLAPRETYLPHFDNYLLTIHPLLPLCNVDTVRQVYVHFWEHLSFSTSAELLVFILAVLYTGATNMTPIQNDHTGLTIIGLYDMLLLALDLPTYQVKSPTTSLWLLQGYVIMNTFRASRLPPFTAFGFLPFAVRFAQSLQLHAPLKADALGEAERFERLWRHLVYMDIESTIASGLPGIIRSVEQGVLSQKLDNNFPSGDEFNVTPMEVAMQGHWQWTNRMHAWLEKMPDHHEIIHFERLIESLLHLMPNRDGNEWARLYLELLIDRAYCMIGLQSWQVERFKGTTCHSEVVRTSRSFLKKFLRLSEISTNSGFTWFIPGLIQPIHALIILLMHLSSCPHPDDERELSRDLVDRVFGLRVGHITTSQPILKNTPSANQQYNVRYRTLSAMRICVWKQLKWPLVPMAGSQEQPTVVDPSNPVVAENLLPDWDAAMNIDLDDQALWNDPMASGILPESPDWDAWFLPVQNTQ